MPRLVAWRRYASQPHAARAPTSASPGPDAEDYLQRMVSNDVAALGPGESCEALLLTPKARVIAPLVVWRRGDDDFLLLTEPELGERVRARARCARASPRSARSSPRSTPRTLVFGGDGRDPDARLRRAGGRGARRRASSRAARRRRARARCGSRRGTPRWGQRARRPRPARRGRPRRARVTFTKGCYPGQEPIARLHYRGHANRGLRVLELDGDELPEPDAELVYDGKAVGRVTSAVRDGGVVALAYVRVEVPDGRGARRRGRSTATQLH